ncbi:MAG: hypothetical protein CMC08_06775 [Flavobacteriaceae bacterium]|nr:hypothetical protein [Flavobacteriaceae bacterium]
MKRLSVLGNTLSVLFALLTLTLGIMNMARGNDFEFGIFLVMLSLIFLPPVTNFLKQRFGLPFPIWLKIIIAALVVWVNLAVGAINEGYYPEIL